MNKPNPLAENLREVIDHSTSGDAALSEALNSDRSGIVDNENESSSKMPPDSASKLFRMKKTPENPVSPTPVVPTPVPLAPTTSSAPSDSMLQDLSQLLSDDEPLQETAQNPQVAPLPVTHTPKPIQIPHKPVVQKVNTHKRIGDVLVDLGMVDAAQLQSALSESKATGSPIGSVLIKLGYVTEIQLGQALASLHGLPYMDTEHLELDPDVMKTLPDDFIQQNMVIPISVDYERKRIEVLMARPDKLQVLDEVALHTGLRPVPKVSTHKEMLKLLDKFFQKYASSEDALAKLEEDLSKSDNIYGGEVSSELEAEMAADDAPVVQLVNSILYEAIDKNASDVHIEPQKERLLVRYRIDGILREVKSIPRKMAGAVTSRIKVASGMDIAEKRRPQDGRMKLSVGSQEIDMRVNSLAVQFGEKIVIRILKPTATTGGLEKLGLTSEEAKRIYRMIKAPNGIILVTGPTGSGKTTTLYGCLREINSPERNITTIEDPIEYPLSGINQTQISHKAGLTFSLCLRAILRQDPDVIMVGEIRDEETLEAAIHAALTGHLVFSTIHTNSTAKTISRLLEMGAPPYLVSSAVIGILAQRLVRKICTQCKTSYVATEEERQILGMADKPEEEITLYKGEGCDYCENTGYDGRVGLYEILNLDREIQELIDNGASVFAVQDAAVKNGMLTLAMDGKRKALAV
ncbi:MAG: GspE/PulE family protein [Vampirovibrio sp.]|nr:GspE/PulE family protein [Vampirovibrio sp.]